MVLFSEKLRTGKPLITFAKRLHRRCSKYASEFGQQVEETETDKLSSGDWCLWEGTNKKE